MRVLIPALVTFLPGGLLTAATLDLAAGETISGSRRLVAGTMQLVLLSFGRSVGAPSWRASRSTRRSPTRRGTRSATGRRELGVLVFGRLRLRPLLRPVDARWGWLVLVLGGRHARPAAGASGRLGRPLGASSAALVLTPVAAWVETSTVRAAAARDLPARVLDARAGRRRADRDGRVRRLRPRRRGRPLRPLARHVRVDRARRAGRKGARAPVQVEVIPPSTGSVTPVT